MEAAALLHQRAGVAARKAINNIERDRYMKAFNSRNHILFASSKNGEIRAVVE